MGTRLVSFGHTGDTSITDNGNIVTLSLVVSRLLEAIDDWLSTNGIIEQRNRVVVD